MHVNNQIKFKVLGERLDHAAIRKSVKPQKDNVTSNLVVMGATAVRNAYVPNREGARVWKSLFKCFLLPYVTCDWETRNNTQQSLSVKDEWSLGCWLALQVYNLKYALMGITS